MPLSIPPWAARLKTTHSRTRLLLPCWKPIRGDLGKRKWQDIRRCSKPLSYRVDKIVAIDIQQPHDRTGHADSPSHTLVIDHGIRFFFFIASIPSIHLILPWLESTVLLQIRFSVIFVTLILFIMPTSGIRSLLLLESDGQHPQELWSLESLSTTPHPPLLSVSAS